MAAPTHRALTQVHLSPRDRFSLSHRLAVVLLILLPVWVSAEDAHENLQQQAYRALARRDFSEAIEGFDAAARGSDSVEQAQSFALRSAALLIEIGEHRSALERAVVLETAAVNNTIRRDASILGIRALFHLGRTDDAFDRILRLDPDDPAGMFLTAYLAREAGDDRLADLLEAIHERFPGSLEGALAAGADWISLPTVPSHLFARSWSLDALAASVTADPADDSPASQVAATTSSSQATGIQLGSFSSEQNADRHANRIEQSGWDASVEVNDGGAFRVVIRFESPQSRSDAEQTLLRLRDSGFEGFLLF